MRRAGGWILGVVAVAGMAAGSWLALRPIFKREDVNVVFVRGPGGHDPSNDALESGASFALEEAGDRAGRYRLRVIPEKQLTFGTPAVLIGNSDSIATSNSHLELFRVSAFEVPLLSAGEILLMTGFDGLGPAAVGLGKSSGKQRVALVEDSSSLRSRLVAGSFHWVAERIGLAIAARPDPSLELPERIEETLTGNPDLVFYAGEEAPYVTTEVFFSALRERGYEGALVTVDVDPEVSFLALPAKLPEGTLLISTISPPTAAFASAYEPATGRKAGPHAWPGYLAMKAALEVLERTPSLDSDDLKRTIAALPQVAPVHALYAVKEGKFVFVQNLK